MVENSPPLVDFHSCTGTKPNIGEGMETSRTIPGKHLHQDRGSPGESWGDLMPEMPGFIPCCRFWRWERQAQWPPPTRGVNCEAERKAPTTPANC